MKQTLTSLMFLITMLTAMNVNAGVRILETPKAVVTYAGIKENGIAFDITWANHENPTEIIIRDKNGDLVYRESYTEFSLKRRFVLPKDETQQYTFTIVCGKAKIEKRFLVSTAYIETINVNELK